MSDGAPERPAFAEDRPDVLGRRIGAALLDIGILAVTVIPASLIAGQAETGHGRVSFSLHGGPAIVWFALALLYFVVCEAAWGQTAGKRLLGIRVSDVEGGQPTLGRVVVRNLLRVIDVLPVLYLIGFVVVLASGRRQQRIGDRLAHTIVTRS